MAVKVLELESGGPEFNSHPNCYMHWFLVVLSSTPQPHVDNKVVGILAVRILNFVTFSLTAAQIILVINRKHNNSE